MSNPFGAGPVVGGAPVGVPTISLYPFPGVALGSAAVNSGTTGGTGGSTQITASYSVAPMPVPTGVNYSRVNLLQTHSTAGGTGSVTLANMVGLYTMAGGTALSLYTSFVGNILASHNSSTAQSYRWHVGTDSLASSSSTDGNAIGSNFTGNRNIPLHQGGSGFIPAGQYWVVHAVTKRTAGSNVYDLVSNFQVSEGSTTFGSMLNSTALQPIMPFIGNFSSTSNVSAIGVPVMPASIHTSVITNADNTSRWRVPFVQFQGS